MWRVGKHYNIHVYEDERPVATFHDPADAARAVEAVNSSLRSNWQPIETAPEDDRILVWTERGCTALAEWKDGQWCAVADESYASFIEGGEIYRHWWLEPTHWMPLPEGPK